MKSLGGYVRQHHVGLIALFFAVGGTSFATARVLLPANSVGTKQVINRSLRSIDFKKGQLPRGARGARGPAGTLGAAGAVGATGPRGPKGDPTYRRTIVVSPGSSPAASGAALLAALNGITGATAGNPYLVQIEPGVYDVGNAPLVMKPYVDVQGSGEGATKITGTGKNVVLADRVGTVVGASHAELRFLTVASTGNSPGRAGVAISTVGASPFALIHVTATATGATDGYAILAVASSTVALTDVAASAKGAAYSRGVALWGGSAATLTNVSASATDSSYGDLAVELDNASSASLENVAALATGSGLSEVGLQVWSGDVKAMNSKLKGDDNAISLQAGTVEVADSLVDGGATASVGSTLTCIGTFNPAYTALGAACA